MRVKGVEDLIRMLLTYATCPPTVCAMHTQRMPRRPGEATEEGQRWFDEVRAAQRVVENAENARDTTVREALDHGLGIRGVAKALGVDKMTAHRRYGHQRRNVVYYIDGESVTVPADMVMPHAANLAMRVLGRTGSRMILERENGELPNQQSAIGDVCNPGERLRLVPAPPDDREDN